MAQNTTCYFQTGCVGWNMLLCSKGVIFSKRSKIYIQYCLNVKPFERFLFPVFTFCPTAAEDSTLRPGRLQSQPNVGGRSTLSSLIIGSSLKLNRRRPVVLSVTLLCFSVSGAVRAYGTLLRLQGRLEPLTVHKRRLLALISWVVDCISVFLP